MSLGPFFSVVIPVFNRAHSIVPTLESVRQQTLSDYECIVVDDGSTDGDRLRAIVDHYDHRFRYLRRDNGGAAAARNAGIDSARGQFIAFLDSDDRYLPSKLETDFAALQRVDHLTTFLFSQVYVDRGGGLIWVKPRRGPEANEDISEYLTCAEGFTQTSSVVLSTQLARRVRFDTRLPFGQDTDFAIRAAALGAHFQMHKRPLVVFNDASTEGRVSSSEKYIPMLQWTDRMRSTISERAYYAYRGWHVARLAVSDNWTLSVSLYLGALLRGAFPPKLAIKALLQILMPRSIYRRGVNAALSCIRPNITDEDMALQDRRDLGGKV